MAVEVVGGAEEEGDWHPGSTAAEATKERSLQHFEQELRVGESPLDLTEVTVWWGVLRGKLVLEK